MTAAPAERRRPADPVPGCTAKNRGSNKVLRRLIRNIEAVGGVVRPSCTRTGHWKVYLDGQYIGGLPGTPGDIRALANDIARLRRGGLRIDTKGRPL
jgi:hypothetical protein